MAEAGAVLTHGRGRSCSDSWQRQELFCLSVCPNRLRLLGLTLWAPFPGNKAAAAGS